MFAVHLSILLSIYKCCQIYANKLLLTQWLHTPSIKKNIQNVSTEFSVASGESKTTINKIVFTTFQGFPQPKSIRDISGSFHQETYFPGSSGNAINHEPHHQSILIRQPILPPTVRVNPIPVVPSLQQQPIIVNIPTQPSVDPSVVRSIQNRQKPLALPPPIPTTTRLRTTTEPETSEELDEQSKSAYYNFGTSVHDTINDHEHIRQEVREGLALKGMYSYSDGFFRRTVHYEADEGGYRVTKEEILPIGDGKGPKFNPKGQAKVKSTLTGDYVLSVGDFRLNKKQEEEIEKQRS